MISSPNVFFCKKGSPQLALTFFFLLTPGSWLAFPFLGFSLAWLAPFASLAPLSVLAFPDSLAFST